MLNPDEKDTVSVRIDHQREQYYSEPTKEFAKKDISKVEKLLNPWASYPQLWNKIFLASCIIGVSIDPLFLYIPIINPQRKCLAMDQHMKYLALTLRTATDVYYIFHIIFRLRNALKMANELNMSIFTGFPWLHLLIDVLSILPLPQVIVLEFFAKLAGSRSLMTRKIINLLLILQYIPRLIRVKLSAKELGRGFDSLTRIMWVRGAFLFFLYIIFAHIFGAFWYFHAIFRETACWHKACKNLSGCKPSPFDCQWENPIRNITYLNEFCPVDPPNPAVYDFGIFSDAMQSKILQTKDFLRKFSRSFWWGLKNLSSFGQNLDTSGNIQENFFAVVISISGLFIFLYLIGTLQTYMQLETTKSEEARRKLSIKQPEIDSFLSSQNLPSPKKKAIMQFLRRMISEDKDFDVKRSFALLEEHSEHGQNKSENFAAWVKKILDVKKQDRNTSELEAESWVEKNGVSADMKVKIMRYVWLRLIEGKDVDVGSLLSILPLELGLSLKKFLCFPIFKKVPMLENMDNSVYEIICNYVRPVIYGEKSYIVRKDEPMDFMLFVTQGTVWSFGSTNPSMKCLKRGDFYGEELLEWRLNSVSISEFPISGSNLKCHTKVEGFTLMVVDLEHVLSDCCRKFSSGSTEALSEGLKLFAAASLQQGWFR